MYLIINYDYTVGPFIFQTLVCVSGFSLPINLMTFSEHEVMLVASSHLRVAHDNCYDHHHVWCGDSSSGKSQCSWTPFFHTAQINSFKENNKKTRRLNKRSMLLYKNITISIQHRALCQLRSLPLCFFRTRLFSFVSKHVARLLCIVLLL